MPISAARSSCMWDEEDGSWFGICREIRSHSDKGVSSGWRVNIAIAFTGARECGSV